MTGRNTKIESTVLLLVGALFMLAALFFAFTMKTTYSGALKSLNDTDNRGNLIFKRIVLSTQYQTS